jgi:hypothetical protein
MRDTSHLALPIADWLQGNLQPDTLLPIHVAVIGANGAFVVGTFDRTDEGLLEPTMVKQLGEFMAFPVNVFAVDSSGVALEEKLILSAESQH